MISEKVLRDRLNFKYLQLRVNVIYNAVNQINIALVKCK